MPVNGCRRSAVYADRSSGVCLPARSSVSLSLFLSVFDCLSDKLLMWSLLLLAPAMRTLLLLLCSKTLRALFSTFPSSHFFSFSFSLLSDWSPKSISVSFFFLFPFFLLLIDYFGRFAARVRPSFSLSLPFLSSRSENPFDAVAVIVSPSLGTCTYCCSLVFVCVHFLTCRWQCRFG